MSLDLPLIWVALIAVAIMLYVLLDGLDLGVGILFPFARSAAERDTMMQTIAPYWDGNETWLILGGGGLFAAFPLAYSILLPALYLPIMLMLLALILRGVAFEFRLRARQAGKGFWTAAFAAGSLAAAIAQGLALGGFIAGVTVRDGAFAGGPFDWAGPRSWLYAAGLTAGYALLGAGWLMIKTRDALHGDARRWGAIAAVLAALLLGAVSIETLTVNPHVGQRWGFGATAIRPSVMAPLLPIPALGVLGLAIVAVGLRRRSHGAPFVGALLVFLSGYLGLAVSFFPDIVPYGITFRQAANAENALGLMLVGVAILLPVILGYTAFVYWIFRGKVAAGESYHD